NLKQRKETRKLFDNEARTAAAAFTRTAGSLAGLRDVNSHNGRSDGLNRAHDGLRVSVKKSALNVCRTVLPFARRFTNQVLPLVVGQLHRVDLISHIVRVVSGRL